MRGNINNIFLKLLFCNLIFPVKSENVQQIKIVHMNRIIERAPTIYSINPEIKNNGTLGSRMGIKDNNTTGKFTNQKFELIVKNIKPNESAKKIFEELGWGINGLETILTELKKYSSNIILIKDIEIDQKTNMNIFSLE